MHALYYAGTVYLRLTIVNTTVLSTKSTSIEPKKALSETTELKRVLTQGGEATWLEGEAGGGKTITARSAANTTVYARRVATLGAGEEERGGGPLLLHHRVIVRGGGEERIGR